MKTYKIKYGGYFDKTTDKDNKVPADFRPIIFNNFFSNNINLRFKNKYLDFDYYYHRDNYDIESKETVEMFLKNPDAIDCALNLISFWIINLFNYDNKNKNSNCVSYDSYFVNKEYWNNYYCLNSNNINTFLEDYPNIISYFSDENIKYSGIGDVLLGQDNYHLFSLGPIFKENPAFMEKFSIITSGIEDSAKNLINLGSLKSLYTSMTTNPTDFLTNAVTQSIDKGLKNKNKIINFMESDFSNKPRFYYIKKEKNLKIYLKHTYFKKYFTNKDQIDYNKLYFIHNFSETISDYTNSFKKYFGNNSNLLEDKKNNNNNYHITQNSLKKIKYKINEINKQINLLDQEIKNKNIEFEEFENTESHKDHNDIIIFLNKKKNSLKEASKYLENYLEEWEKNAFTKEDIINASHILRQACYIHKIRMLIYINYDKNDKNDDFYKTYKETIKTQLTVSKLKQPIFTNIIKDNINPILYGIEKFLQTKTDSLR
jgi:hypothetical protein